MKELKENNVLKSSSFQESLLPKRVDRYDLTITRNDEELLKTGIHLEAGRANNFIGEILKVIVDVIDKS